MHLRIATWNVNCWNPGRSEQKRRLLDLEPWDVALLQEVGPRPFTVFASGVSDAVSAVDLVGGAWGGRSHGAAVLVREPWRISSSGVITGDDPQAEAHVKARGMWAELQSEPVTLTVASVHALNAAGVGDERARKITEKMAQFRLLADWIASVAGPLVLGMDVNAWEDWAQPRVPEAVDPTDPFHDQSRFVEPGAAHGLRDAFLDHLTRRQPELLERRRALGVDEADGALEVTYQRSPNFNPKTNRMDRIYCSEHFDVLGVRTLYSDALTVGSDHAMVIADLELAS